MAALVDQADGRWERYVKKGEDAAAAAMALPPLPLSRTSSSALAEQRRVAVVGTGALGAALGNRLAQAGYAVTFGSRSGKTKNAVRGDCLVVSVKTAIFMGDIVILALPPKSISSFVTEAGHALEGKVVVDTSNPGVQSEDGQSMGELVAGLLPASLVVKAFNTLSAYQINAASTSAGPKVVELCSNSSRAKMLVANMIYDMGLMPADLGSIKAAGKMERKPFIFYTKWRQALLVSLALFLPCFAYVVVRDVHYGEGWSHIPLSGISGAVGWLSINLITATYSAGLIATVLPKPLPRWLISWLEIRKQLGLLAFFFAAWHAAGATLILRDGYKHTAALFDGVGRLTALGESSLLVGLLGLACLAILSITSLPSVVASLSWREWDFVHKKLGWLSVILSLGHVVIFATPLDWPHSGRWPRSLPPATIFILAPISLLVVCKLLFILSKNFSAMLRRMRRYRTVSTEVPV
eukprot:SM000075S21964  [mRNA]  locus=s75:345626:348503:+ [translate_table: standard]